MRLLYDAALPHSLADDAPAGVEFVRWAGGEANDATLIRTAANQECSAVLLYGRDSLAQPELRTTASEVGVALVAVDAQDPIEAKGRILGNFGRLRKMLTDHDCLLVLARDVRPYSD